MTAADLTARFLAAYCNVGIVASALVWAVLVCSKRRTR